MGISNLDSLVQSEKGYCVTLVQEPEDTVDFDALCERGQRCDRKIIHQFTIIILMIFCCIEIHI